MSRLGEIRARYSGANSTADWSIDAMENAPADLAFLIAEVERLTENERFHIAETSGYRSRAETAERALAEARGRIDGLEKDAERWRALLASPRIRILGWAGFDKDGNGRPENPYRHFGMEIWSMHDAKDSALGQRILTEYADAMAAIRSGGGTHG